MPHNCLSFTVVGHLWKKIARLKDANEGMIFNNVYALSKCASAAHFSQSHVIILYIKQLCLMWFLTSERWYIFPKVSGPKTTKGLINILMQLRLHPTMHTGTRPEISKKMS